MNHSKATDVAPTATLTLLDSEPGSFSFFALQNVMIIVWPAHATGRAVQRLRKASRPMAKDCPNGVSHIHLVREGTHLPTAEARAGFVALIEDLGSTLACVAVVLPGGGFWSSAVRSAVVGIRLLTKRTWEMRMHGAIEGVRSWLPAEHLKRTGVVVDAQTLDTALKRALGEGMEQAVADSVPARASRG